MDRAPRRRALIGMAPLALAATSSAVTGALAGVEAARREDRWRRALV